MTDRTASTERQDPERPGHHPTRVRLPGFLIDHDVGLGDVIKRATASVGVRPCGGCARRAAALNKWVVFAGRAGRRPG